MSKPVKDVAARLKSLGHELTREKERHDHLVAQSLCLQLDAEKHGKRIKQIEAEMKKLRDTSKDPIVSEHALLRYIERHLGLDLAQLRAQVLTPTAIEQIDTFGLARCKVPGPDGLMLVVENRVVKTVVNGRAKKRRTKA